jgi:hypothetical protein
MDVVRVRAHWDDDAQVWWAESDDVPGLATEAATFEELGENVRSIAPDLLSINKGVTDPVQIELTRA